MILYLELWQVWCSVDRPEQNAIFIGANGEHSCEFVLNLEQR